MILIFAQTHSLIYFRAFTLTLFYKYKVNNIVLRLNDKNKRTLKGVLKQTFHLIFLSNFNLHPAIFFIAA